MQTRKILIALGMVVSLILAGCTSTNTPNNALSDVSWFLINLNSQPVLSETLVTINFANGKINGTDGCNHYSTSYTVKGSKFSVNKKIATTLMACPEPIMQQASAYITALTQAAAYKIDGQQLTLLDAGGKTLATFTTVMPATATPTTVMPTTVTPTIITPTAVTPATQTPQTGASIAKALSNADYPVEGTSTGMAQLKDGFFEEPVAPGSATKMQIHLGTQQAFGDVNGDGTEDAAVTLVVDPGGSGTFTYLALVLNDNGSAKPVSSILLGDRIIVKSLAIQSGSVVVIMLTRNADEPMSTEPTLEVTRTFQLQGDKLVEVK